MNDPTARASRAATAARDAEGVVQDSMAILQATLGQRTPPLPPGALEPGAEQFFVAGGFFVTPDRRHQMLVGNTGFPPDQRRLLIPIDGGHPGRVIASGQPLLLHDTRGHPEFRQYLRTARMGSAVYAPLFDAGVPIGLVIVAAKAFGTLGQGDLDALVAVAGMVGPRWLALGGPDWLAREYARVAPPA